VGDETHHGQRGGAPWDATGRSWTSCGSRPARCAGRCRRPGTGSWPSTRARWPTAWCRPRLKEAAALAIAVVKRCDGCIAYHAKAAARAGATPQEVAELLAVALLMDGGTASVYGPRAWEAFHEFRDAAAPAAASA